MKIDAVSAADLSRSVIAVPPLARTADLRLARAANASLVRHLEAGGVRTLLYGGNANLYHVGLYEYAALLDELESIASPATWVIPSAGPDLGKLIDQAQILRARRFPTAMALPLTFPMTMPGVATGLRRFAEALGRPIVVYLKAEGYLTPELVKSLVDDGIVAAIKYAIVRKDPREDAFLSRLLDLVDRRLVVSGIGERPAIVHLRDFGLAAFTSGSVCVGPRGSTQLLAACQRKDWATAERLRERYLPLEDLRDAHSPIRVLHEAVTLAGIADMGPMLPLLSNLEPEHHGAVQAAARALRAVDAT
jgi:dihydrodipicolinate synthase/N-acetylneuraminate lyase